MSADEFAVGRAMTLDGEPFTVVGILPAAFKPPAAVREAQLFLPLAPDGADGQNRGGRYLNVAARLHADATTGQASTELATIARRLEQAFPDSNGGRGVNVRRLHEATVEGARPPIVVLFVAVTFLLLIAATNVAHLLLPRALARRHEVAVRVALGASRLRVARQLLTEIVLLWLMGAAAGIALATWLVSLIVAFAPAQVPRLDEVTVDRPRAWPSAWPARSWPGLAFGLLPALQATRVQPADSLHGGRMPGLARRRLSGALVAAEVALALVLLVGAGLVVESLRHLVAEPPGFDADGVLTAEINLPAKRYSTPASRAQFYASLLPRLAALPGVSETGLVTPLPFSSDSVTDAPQRHRTRAGARGPAAQHLPRGHPRVLPRHAHPAPARPPAGGERHAGGDAGGGGQRVLQPDGVSGRGPDRPPHPHRRTDGRRRSGSVRDRGRRGRRPSRHPGPGDGAGALRARGPAHVGMGRPRRPHRDRSRGDGRGRAPRR
jgi:putative ABC transport system permease protein